MVATIIFVAPNCIACLKHMTSLGPISSIVLLPLSGSWIQWGHLKLLFVYCNLIWIPFSFRVWVLSCKPQNSRHAAGFAWVSNPFHKIVYVAFRHLLLGREKNLVHMAAPHIHCVYGEGERKWERSSYLRRITWWSAGKTARRKWPCELSLSMINHGPKLAMLITGKGSVCDHSLCVVTPAEVRWSCSGRERGSTRALCLYTFNEHMELSWLENLGISVPHYVSSKISGIVRKIPNWLFCCLYIAVGITNEKRYQHYLFTCSIVLSW